ncbi:hypothetical protein GVAV_003443 [Gurleya vavrai]
MASSARFKNNFIQISPIHYPFHNLTCHKDSNDYFYFQYKHDIKNTDDFVNLQSSIEFKDYRFYLNEYCLCIDNKMNLVECIEEPFTTWKVKPVMLGYALCTDWLGDLASKISGMEYCLTIEIENLVSYRRITKIYADIKPFDASNQNQIFRFNKLHI